MRAVFLLILESQSEKFINVGRFVTVTSDSVTERKVALSCTILLDLCELVSLPAVSLGRRALR